jgi:hypothetical protein
MKLITEHFDNVEYLTEDIGGIKSLFIEGIYMQAEVENRNRRIYPRAILENAVGRYVAEQIQTSRAVGELNHPDSPKINLDKVSHKIQSLLWSGNDVIGKSKVLDTPMGRILRGLIEGGVKLGVSSRALGSITTSKGQNLVNDDLIISAIDVVQDPSAHDAFVNGIMEGVEYFIKGNEIIVEDIRKTIHRAPSARLPEVKQLAYTRFMKTLSDTL